MHNVARKAVRNTSNTHKRWTLQLMQGAAISQKHAYAGTKVSIKTPFSRGS